MANYFARYDDDAVDAEPAGETRFNHFAQYDEPASGPSFGDRLAGAFGATQRGAADALTFGLAPRIRAAAHATIDAAQGQGFDYSARLEDERAREAEDQRRLPFARLGGQLLGGVALPAGMGLPGGLAPAGAGLPELAARGAVAGAIQGGAQGAGSSEDLSDLPQVARDARTGAMIGAGIGGAFPLAAAGLGAAARGLRNGGQLALSPEKVAARQVGEALSSDAATAARRAASDAPGTPARALSGEEFAAARETGAPVVLGDRGAEATRNLARTSSNLSDEAGNVLSGALEPRFEGQSRRIAQKFDELNPIVGATGQTIEDLKKAADDALKPLYDKARAEGAGGVWSDALGELTRSPAVAEAIRKADRIGADRAALAGRKPPQNPFTMEAADGSVQLRTRKTMLADGRYVDEPIRTPSLDFWDNVKRGLDDRIEAAYGAGNRAEGARLTAIKTKMVGELDAAVPSYAAARGTAERYFGGQDALTAGAEFARGQGATDDMLKGLFAMPADERKLFAHAYANQIKADILKAPDRRDLLNRLLESEDRRMRLKAAIGPKGFEEMQTFRNVEDAMEKLRKAVAGNSTTVKQGLRAKVFENGGVQAAGAALVGSHIGGFPGGVILPLLTTAMRKFVGARRAEVAADVARMLVSDDPATYARAIEAVARDKALAEFFRRAAHFGAKAVIPTAAER